MTDRLNHELLREILAQLGTQPGEEAIEEAIRRIETEAVIEPAAPKPIRGTLGEAIAGTQLFAPGDPQARMDAYYYGFKRTGFGIIDNILSAVAIAGKHHHSTEGWIDDDPDWGAVDGISEEARIQAAAEASAEVLRTIKGRLERG